MTSTNHKSEFKKVIRELSRRHETWRVFTDFCHMTALSFFNVIPRRDDIEERYQKIFEPYNEAERLLFPDLVANTVNALDQRMHDFLGELFMELELSNHWKGQFFTPYAICRLMAEFTVDGSEEQIKRDGYATLHEPACGAGAMIIAYAESMLDRGLNSQTQLHVTAIDVSNTAAYMTFIQLSLLHIPAVVYVGNTISMEMRERLPTLAHHLGLWEILHPETGNLTTKTDNSMEAA